MKKNAKQLKQLARLAQIRSDAELKRFVAFRTHVDAVRLQGEQMRGKLASVYERNDAFSIAEARLASQEAGRIAHRIAQVDVELARLWPSFDIARQRAVREFGRVQILNRLASDADDDGSTAN